MIVLVHDLIVETTPNNYILMLDKHKQDKKGEPVYETIGYYGSLSGAVRGARTYCIRKKFGEGTSTLCEAIEKINKITDEFKSLLDEVIHDA